MVCIEPRIFFFVLEKSATSAASKASRTFVRTECQVVSMDEILSSPPSDHTFTHVTIHFEFAVIPRLVLDTVEEILATQPDNADIRPCI